jgi:hypothetical protein
MDLSTTGVKKAGPRQPLSRILGTGRERKDLAESVPADNEEAFEHFCLHGWMRVRALAKVGIRRSDPSTWTKERPEHLQHLKTTFAQLEPTHSLAQTTVREAEAQ